MAPVILCMYRARSKAEHNRQQMANGELAESSSPMQGDTDKVQVDRDEFEQWWYIQKHGRPKSSPCPDEVLGMLCCCIRALPSSPGDEIVAKGSFGHRLYPRLF
jgi:hypothetical protein